MDAPNQDPEGKDGDEPSCTALSGETVSELPAWPTVPCLEHLGQVCPRMPKSGLQEGNMAQNGP